MVPAASGVPRPTALAIYATGVDVGVAVVFIGGAWVSDHFVWRSVFCFVPLRAFRGFS